MVIAHIISTYPPYKGGMGNVAKAMVTELEKRGHECLVLTPGKSLKPWFRFSNSALVPLVYFKLKKADIIHLHYPFFGAAIFVALYKLFHPKKKMLMSYHMDTIGKGWMKVFFKIYRAVFFPFIKAMADEIFVSSLDYGKNSQLKSERMVELPFGADYVFKPNLELKPKEGFNILFVAALDKSHYFKGLENLIEALDDSMQLTVVGKGDMLDYYKEKAKGKNIKFLGGLEFHDLVKEYQRAHCTVLPSIDQSEAFGLVLVESMACGTPVIASNLPGVRSVLEDGKTGYIVKVNDASDLRDKLNLMKNNWSSLVQNSIDRVNLKYRWDKVIDIYEDYLN